MPPTPRIVAYVEALVARYPDDVDRGVVWTSPPVIDEASGPIVYLLMSCSKAEEVSEYAAALAREHGLVCFDPQGECSDRELCALQRADQRKMPARRRPAQETVAVFS